MLKNNFDNSIINKILEETSDGFLIIDENLNILQALPGALQILELTEIDTSFNLNDFLKGCYTINNINDSNPITIITAKGNEIESEIISFKMDSGNYLIKITPVCSSKVKIISEARKQKSAFIANLSHDLKNPMQSIMGFSQALLEGISGELPPDQKKYISIIYKNSNKLMRMINNLIDLSKFESGRLSVNYGTFNLNEFNQSIESETISLIGNKNITFSIITNKINIEELYTDKERLEQIILSLIDSSINFTDEGNIKLTYCHPTHEIIIKANGNRFIDAKEEAFLLITISDTGKGIPEEFSCIFKEQISPKGLMTREYGTSGLALIAASKIIEALDGKIWLSKNNLDEITCNLLLPI